MLLGFQNCSKVGFAPDSASSALKSSSDDLDRDLGDDGLLGGSDDLAPGDDGNKNLAPGDDIARNDEDDEGMEDDEDWLYIPGGRGHVPMSAVAVCPAGSKDEGNQKCPFFCYKGVDYVMHKSEARNYFAKKFDEQPDYGGGAVPGTCAKPDLKIKN